MRKIILLGYMGCGKSTIAHKLSKIIRIPYLDLDKCIEERTNLSVNEIFEQRGEIFFRKIEHEVLLELINLPESLIIGLGGGTPCYANNHELLNGKNILSIYLKASIETLLNRLINNKSNRPIIASLNEHELKEFIAKHLFDRSYYYNQASEKITVDDKTVDETILDILEILA